jgi:predicted HTH domain antitoxin
MQAEIELKLYQKGRLILEAYSHLCGVETGGNGWDQVWIQE